MRFKLSVVSSVAMLLMLTACGEEEPPIDVEPCIAVAVQTRAADGSCVWASSCDVSNQEICNDTFECWELPPDACLLDSRCQLGEQFRCPDCLPTENGADCRCGSVPVCEPIVPTDPCSPLGEAACMATPGCQGEYGWSDGSGTSTEPAPDSDAMPAPPMLPEWGFLRCIVASTNDRCEALDVDACMANPACEAIWGSAPCECDPSGMCACPDLAIYEGCVSRPNSGCSAFSDPWACDTAPGCHWEYSYDGMPYPCECAPGTDCLCAAPIPNGYCVRDAGPVNCWAYPDVQSCYSAGCNWVDSWGAPPMPCECREGEPCACDPIVAPGYCEDPMPQSCYDYYDAYACMGNPQCMWFDGSAGD